MESITLRLAAPEEVVPVDLLALAETRTHMIGRHLNDGVAFVAEQDETILGACVMSQVSPETVELRLVAVYPDYRNQGIGKSLIEYAAEMASEAGCVEIIAGTGNVDLTGILFLQKSGFEMDSIEKNYYDDPAQAPVHHGLTCLHKVWFLRHLNS